MGSNSHVALWRRYPQGHPSESGWVLTNRMSELLKYGSVGGVGRKPGPYPAGNAGLAFKFQLEHDWPGVPESGRWTRKEKAP